MSSDGINVDGRVDPRIVQTLETLGALSASLEALYRAEASGFKAAFGDEFLHGVIAVERGLTDLVVLVGRDLS